MAAEVADEVNRHAKMAGTAHGKGNFTFHRHGATRWWGTGAMVGRNFGRSESGNFSMMFALMLPILLGSTGLAVDVASMMRAQAQLQNATDAAVLAASRINDKSVSRETVFEDFLAANIAGNTGLRDLEAGLEIDVGINYISTIGTASAEVDLNFSFMFGDAKRISVSASAYESRNNLEVVMALDNTGSMGTTRMAQLRKAATSLVDILALAHAPDTEPKRVVRAALVPFVTAVNVRGEGFNWGWIDNQWDEMLQINRPLGAKHHGTNFEPRLAGENWSHIELFKEMGIEWKGCVEARAAPYNLTDDAPDQFRPDTLFVPYFAPDEPGNARLPKDSGSEFNNTYLDDLVPTSLSNGSALQKQRNIYKYTNASQNFVRNGHTSTTAGPNYACPTPIMPLTSDFTALKAEIGKMIHWYGSGTNVSEGLAWSHRVLSPGEPYTQGAPFKSEHTSKFVVVFTDGENNVFGASSQSINKSDYGSYGFLVQGLGQNESRVHTNRSNALTKVNTWTQEACTALKNQDVEVFTVLLGADTQANRTLYSKCATTPDHYYPTSDVNQLDAVFTKIASRIAKLYLTQ